MEDDEMYTSPFRKFLRRYLLVWIVAVAVLLVLYVIFLSPLSPFHRCTLIGCRDTLELTLSHEPTSPYTLLLTSSTGETRRITCTPGVASANSDNSAICRTGIVSIYRFTPSSVTVVITWPGESYSMSGDPVYDTFHPNGLFCPPICRLGKLSLDLP
jgi:hypothetical protein